VLIQATPSQNVISTEVMSPVISPAVVEESFIEEGRVPVNIMAELTGRLKARSTELLGDDVRKQLGTALFRRDNFNQGEPNPPTYANIIDEYGSEESVGANQLYDKKQSNVYDSVDSLGGITKLPKKMVPGPPPRAAKPVTSVTGEKLAQQFSSTDNSIEKSSSERESVIPKAFDDIIDLLESADKTAQLNDEVAVDQMFSGIFPGASRANSAQREVSSNEHKFDTALFVQNHNEGVEIHVLEPTAMHAELPVLPNDPEYGRISAQARSVKSTASRSRQSSVESAQSNLSQASQMNLDQMLAKRVASQRQTQRASSNASEDERDKDEWDA
jgi:hypothetical protein